MLEMAADSDEEFEVSRLFLHLKHTIQWVFNADTNSCEIKI